MLLLISVHHASGLWIYHEIQHLHKCIIDIPCITVSLQIQKRYTEHASVLRHHNSLLQHVTQTPVPPQISRVYATTSRFGMYLVKWLPPLPYAVRSHGLWSLIIATCQSHRADIRLLHLHRNRCNLPSKLFFPSRISEELSNGTKTLV